MWILHNFFFLVLLSVSLVKVTWYSVCANSANPVEMAIWCWFVILSFCWITFKYLCYWTHILILFSVKSASLIFTMAALTKPTPSWLVKCRTLFEVGTRDWCPAPLAQLSLLPRPGPGSVSSVHSSHVLTPVTHHSSALVLRPARTPDIKLIHSSNHMHLIMNIHCFFFHSSFNIWSFMYVTDIFITELPEKYI